VFITKQTTLIQSNTTQVYLNSLGYLTMYAACFGLHLGNPQACQNNPASVKNTSNQRGILIRPLNAKHEDVNLVKSFCM